jgi:hypothetical protein
MNKGTITTFCIIVWACTFIPGWFIQHQGDTSNDVDLSIIGTALRLVGSITLLIGVIMNW